MKYRLTLMSGVHPANNNEVGDFCDERTAHLVGGLLLAIDTTNHPEYRGYDVVPMESDSPPEGTPMEPMKTNELIYQTRHRMMNGEWSIWHDAQDEDAMNRVVALLNERGIECESRAVPPEYPLH